MTSSIRRSWSILPQTVPGASRALFLFILLSGPAQAIIDINSNGVSDLWEKTYNSGTLFTNFAPLADPDGDDWTNATEAISGTDPFNANTPTGILRPEIIQSPAVYITGTNGEPELFTPAAVSITWPTLAGKQYTLFASVDLSQGSWLTIDNDTPRIGTTDPMGNAFPIAQPDGSSPPTMFYRVAINDADSDGDTLTNHEEAQLQTDPFSIDTDLDGFPDNTDPAPLTSLTLTDPDGAGLLNAQNLPTSLANGLLGRWNFEDHQIITNPPSGYTPFQYPDSAGTNPATSFSVVPHPEGMVSKATNHAGGYVSLPTAVLGARKVYTTAFWARLEPGSISAANGAPVALFSHHQRIPWIINNIPQWGRYAEQLNGLWFEKSGNQERLRAGTHTYTNHLNGVPTAGTTTSLEINILRNSGTADDGKWHHYTFVHNDGVKTLYINGIFIGTATHIPATISINSIYSGISVGRISGPSPAANGYFQGTSPTRGSIDRLRIWNRPLTQTEATALYREDIDKDGLWDITENNRLWRDNNSDTIQTTAERTFSSSPFTWQPTTSDTDGDDLTDIQEQTLGTKIDNPDTDGDLLPDGWEATHSPSLTPLVPNNPNSDTDQDGLTLLDEYRYNTNPTLANTDGDTQNDGAEVGQGSNPNDSSDGGTPIAAEDKISILLGIGDKSGSESEDYVLNCYRLDPQTGQETRIYTLRSGGFGEYKEETQNIFKKGESYTFQIDWQSSNLGYRSAAPGVSAEGPDYDYTFKVQPQTSHAFVLVDSWDPKPSTIHSFEPILNDNANDISDFQERVEKRRVLLFSADVDVDSDNDNQVALPDRSATEDGREDPEIPDTENLGKVLWVNHDDTDSDGIPGYADGLVGVTPGVSELVMDATVVPHSRSFTPVVVAIPDPAKWPSMRLKFTYPGSDPAGVTLSFDANGQGSAVLPAGNLRLWKKDGGVPSRVRRVPHITDGGDWIAPDQEFLPSDLGNRQLDGTVVLYVAAVRPSSQIAGEALTLSVDLDGEEGSGDWKEADTVCFTSMELALMEAGSGGSLARAFHPYSSNTSPDIDASMSLTNVRASANGEAILGDIVVTGNVTGGGADFMPTGTIPEITLRANTDDRNGDDYPDPVYSIQVSGTKSTTGGYDKPYPFTGTYGYTVQDVEIQTGFNTFRLAAVDPLTKLDGMAEFVVQVEAVQGAQGGNLGLLLSSAAVQFTSQPSPLVVDQVTLDWTTRSNFTFSNVVLTETSADSKRFEAPATHPGLVLVLADEGQFGAGVIDTIGSITIYQPTHALSGDRFRLLEEDAIASLTFEGEIFAAYDLDPAADGFIGDGFQVGQVQAGADSEGGTTRAHVIEIRGPESLLSSVSSLKGFGVETAATVLHLGQKVADGKRFVVSPGEVAKTATSFLARETQAVRDRANEFITADREQKKLMLAQGLGAEAAFKLGATHGFMAGGWEMVSGTVVFAWDIGKYTFVANNQTVLVLVEGGREMIRWKHEVDKQMAEVTAFVSDTLVPLYIKLKSAEIDVQLALLRGDFDGARELAEPHLIMFEYMAELLPDLIASWDNLPAYDQGYYTGVAAFEIAGLVGAWTKVGKIGKAGDLAKLGSKANFLAELRTIRFFNSGPGKQAIDGLFSVGGYMERLATTSMCFPAGTLILTKAGSQAIESVRSGDLVWSKDPEKGNLDWKPVVQVFVTHPDRFFRLDYRSEDNEDGVTHTITTTGEHPFWVVGRGAFVPAKELLPGDQLMLANGNEASLKNLEIEMAKEGETFTAYNFEVETWHTYFAGSPAVWVHNRGRACDRAFSIFERFLKRNNGNLWQSYTDALAKFPPALDNKIRIRVFNEARKRHLANPSGAAPWDNLANQQLGYSGGNPSRVLGKNLEATGISRPGNVAGHHIVPWDKQNFPEWGQCRAIIQNDQIDFHEGRIQTVSEYLEEDSVRLVKFMV
jgi:hypothetical protein